MQRPVNFFPGKKEVCFRRGPSGHLRQDPSDEAAKIKRNPSLQDKSRPLKEEDVKDNAYTVVFQRGGDVSDKQEVLGEYVLQFGKYKGKSFRWLLENDVGYTIYLLNKVEEEEKAGIFSPEGHSKDSLLSFIGYARSFKDIEDLRQYLSSRRPAPSVSSEGDNLVGFGARAKNTWQQIWDSRADGYAAFILGKQCVKNSQMYKLQQYLLKQHSLQGTKPAPSTAPPAVLPRTTPIISEPSSSSSVMEEDEELERAMLSLSPSKFQAQPSSPVEVVRAQAVSVPRVSRRPEPTATLSRPADDSHGTASASPSAAGKVPLPIPPELLALVPSSLPTPGTEQQEQGHSKPAVRGSPPSPKRQTVTSPSIGSVSQGVRSSAPVRDEQETALAEALAHPTTAQQHPRPLTHPAPSPPALSAQPAHPASAYSYDQDVRQWNCSLQQRIWMKTELEALGLWPGSRPVRHLMNMVSLWRHPPQPELIETSSKLPSPKHFQLHPFFIWKPEHAIMERVRNNYILPCLHGCASPQVLSAGVGRPRVIVGTSGQYYIFASRLTCKVCRRYWFADKPQWLETLPRRFTNIFPAFLTHKKAICKTVMDELRRTGKSPNDMANQVTELLHLKYERANLAYLLAVQNIRDAEAGLYGQATITGYLQQADSPAPFGQYEDPDGWYGVSVSSHYLTDCLLQEFQRQEAAFTQLLQGTFGQVFRSDHTRRMARKVTFSSGTMSSYAIMNENWMILSWVMLQSECDKSLEPMYEGLANRYSAAGVEKAKYQWVDRDCCAPFRVPDPQPFEHLQWVSWQTTDAIVVQATSGSLINTCASRSKFNQDIAIRLDLFHCMRRLSRECVSEHHALYGTFCKFLSAAFTIVDQGDLQKLKAAYRFCGIVPAEPTKQHIREHCRMKVPCPRELVQRVEDVLRHFHLAKDPNDTLLYKPSMLKVWRIQRVHILRGCLSDAEVEDGVLYRYGGTVQLNHVKGDGATVPVWIPIRGTSQQEGFHSHQARWVTGNQVSNELFQAQGLAGVARWNFQRLVDLKLPEVVLPAVFDPVLVCELNQASEKVMGQIKYPALHITGRDTGERFGLQYLEPGCRPVPLDWQKHKTQKTVLPPPVETQLPSTRALSAPPVVLHFPPTVEDKRDTDTAQSFESGEPSVELDPSLTARTLPSPQSSQQTAFSHPKLSTKREEESNILSSMDTGLQSTSPLPRAASPRAARTGPVKTGGLLFVLDHNRWPSPMRAAIDGLLAKRKGEKDFLQQVDRDYAALVQSTCSDPNSLLHPTTRQHISRYVKYLAKQTNASTSLNTSPEKLQETQQLWQHLTAGSQTVAVPVVTLPSALINPITSHGSDTQGAPVTKATVEKLVQEILQKQQAVMQPQKKKTRNCLACGQPKSRYLGDGSSIHHFYQSGEVKFFYCSTRMYQTYAGEGLTNPRMPFLDFTETPFFQRELEASRQRGTERKRVLEERGKRKSVEALPSGRLCRFCHQPLKQGPNSPHVHTYFPGVAGKYIYCPAKVLSLYQGQGMAQEMSWREFQNSKFYEAEKNRWVVEKGK